MIPAESAHRASSGLDDVEESATLGHYPKWFRNSRSHEPLNERQAGEGGLGEQAGEDFGLFLMLEHCGSPTR
ncbi:hypothetical protein PA1R_gp1510 [Pseudomonas aeruginosa PA1R]|nr:hypothetical protein PA1R_gp1510 [Pseudomonas aeruginosa PA1R]